jgi:1-acyl-sn-glycerol-3-phosphate acyltransferase
MGEWLWYEFCLDATWIVSTLAWSFRFEGSRHVPAEGPALLVANHQSFLDPAVASLAARRHLNFLARHTLFKNRFFGWLIDSLGAVPVDQVGVAKEGMKTVLELLQKGKAVLVFPEGNRTEDGQMQELKPGVLLLIKRSLAPIVPVGIAGAFNLFPRHQKLPWFSPVFLPAPRGGVAVSIGRPLEARRFVDLPREQALAELHEKIHAVQVRAERLRRKA